MREYDHKKIEPRWQKEWERKGIYHAKDPGKDKTKKPKYYSLIEFPYPSGDGLHVGHPRPYIGMDIISRKRRMQGYNVLYPIGWDAFGLPTENYAIKTGKDPRVVTKKNSDIFRRQIKSLGISFDWSREINTTDPKYYKWTQWIFLQFLKKGLAYKAKMTINWCSKDKIGLANEEVINGACERCGTVVEKREKEQWMLAITKYADRLYKDLDDVDYLPQIKLGQRNWIGKSEGAEIEFKIQTTHPLLPSQREGTFGYQTTDPKTWRVLQEKVLEMRNNPTEAEEKLWRELKGNLIGFHFRRQQIFDKFVADFVCLSKNLVIEIDGDIHDYQKEKDEERTEILKILGCKIIRFKNDEVLKNTVNVIDKIKKELEALPLGEGLGVVKVFTTRPDTIFGATFIAIAPELAKKITGKDFGIKVDTDRDNKEKIGIDTGLKAKNPVNGEMIPVFVVNYVSADYGTGAIMGVPAHDERDWEFVKKYNLPIKQVIMPDNLDIKNSPRVGKKNTIRNVVHVILRDRENKTVLLEFLKGDHWGNNKPVNFIIGGIENGENEINAAIREIKEETGYTNIKFIEKIPFEVQARFFAAHKDVNRTIHVSALVFDLLGQERIEISEEEKKLHDLKWISENEVHNTVTIPDDKMIWKYFYEGNSAFIGDGILINSDKFSGMDSEKAKKEIVKFVGGKEKTTFKLRDWIFSRQRYWGEPIPVVYCLSKGSPCSNTWVPVSEKDLPVELPKVKNYQPTDSGESPLANIKSFVDTRCPLCGGRAKRETDTMPNWAGSSWYYLRYTDSKNNKEFASKKNLKYWLGVDWYNGGNEHTTLHLLYSRFWHKFLFDLKLVPTSEPYMKRTSHGMILGEGGVKMSKSLGNVINPDDIVKIYGADTLRIYEMFMGPFDQSVAWSTESIIGARRFVEKVWRIGEKISSSLEKNSPAFALGRRPMGEALGDKGQGTHGSFNFSPENFTKLLHKTIKKVSEDIESMSFNTAISAMMILATEMESAFTQGFGVTRESYKKFLQILSPFAPHITEELWSMLGEKKSISFSDWPKWSESLIKDEEIRIVVQINGKVRAEIMIQTDEREENVKEKALKNNFVLKYLDGRDIKKTFYIKNRLINIVI